MKTKTNKQKKDKQMHSKKMGAKVREKKLTCWLWLRRRSRGRRVEIFGADGDAHTRRGRLILLLLLRLLLLGALLGVLAVLTAHTALTDSTLKSRKLHKLHLKIFVLFSITNRTRFRFSFLPRLCFHSRTKHQTISTYCNINT